MRPTHKQFIIRASILAVVLGLGWLGFTLWLYSNSEDRAVKKKMIGKWGMYVSGSSLSAPPMRVIEWLPNGDTFLYSDDLERMPSQTQRGVDYDVYFNRGEMLTVIKNSQSGSPQVLREPMRWINDDLYEMGEALSGSAIQYRRITEAEFEKLKSDAKKLADELEKVAP